MERVRAKVGALLEQHLGQILDAVIAAYERSIPRVASASPDERELVVGGTRAAIKAFARLFSDPGESASALLSRARTATIERAGEVFSRDEILDMMRIARQVVVHTMREIAGSELDLDDRERAAIDEALDAFLSEIGRAETELLPQSAVDILLAGAESEEADLR